MLFFYSLLKALAFFTFLILDLDATLPLHVTTAYGCLPFYISVCSYIGIIVILHFNLFLLLKLLVILKYT